MPFGPGDEQFLFFSVDLIMLMTLGDCLARLVALGSGGGGVLPADSIMNNVGCPLS